MSKSIYIMSTASASGKTAVSIGLFLVFKEDGMNSGYFKPIGDPFSDVKVTKADKDVNVIHRMLDRKYSREEICPIFISPTAFLDEIPFDKVKGVQELIKDAFEEMASKTDILFIEGNHDYTQFHSLGLDDPQLAKLLESPVVLVSMCKDDSDLDKIIMALEEINRNELDLKGIILTNMTDLQLTKIKEKYEQIFQRRNVPLLGVIPQSKLLSSPTVGEVLEATGGKLLTEEINVVKDNRVERFIIGAMQCNDAITYMRKSQNLGVITGGDRSDIILTAIELGVSLIVLTGNLQPEVQALAKAEEEGIPIILVSTDTYTTAMNIQNVRIQIQQGETDLCKEQAQKYLDWKKLY
ncbi:MAG: phosphotransacetylase family protein [Candidatus Lokiarchaeota archaeon]|nr:phosphotransacetylase family protein [Candidatus Lokiarchaeota archaeon]